MSVWLCIPSARPPAESTAHLWKEKGYGVALFRDPGAPRVECADLVLEGEYPGYAVAVNALAAEVLERDPECLWIVAGGDDTAPDQNHSPEEIAEECNRHFNHELVAHWKAPDPRYASTFGVMQPTGDRFANGSIDRIAGSPWMGSEWCKRANQGQGPLYPEFTHMFVDEALQRTAQKLGVFWQRPDLIHLHNHFMRKSADINSPAVHATTPAHLRQWTSEKHWNEMQTIFKRLETQDFAPCMPLALVNA